MTNLYAVERTDVNRPCKHFEYATSHSVAVTQFRKHWGVPQAEVSVQLVLSNVTPPFPQEVQ